MGGTSFTKYKTVELGTRDYCHSKSYICFDRDYTLIGYRGTGIRNERPPQER